MILAFGIGIFFGIFLERIKRNREDLALIEELNAQLDRLKDI